MLLFGSVIFLILLALTPAPEGAWAQIAPISHARWKLRTTTHFMGPNASDEVGVMESPVREWRALMAAPEATEVLRELAASGTAAGRVWALSGLWLVDSASARALRAQLAQDSATVTFVDACQGTEVRSVASLADLVSRPGWVVALRDSVSKCVWRAPGAAG